MSTASGTIGNNGKDSKGGATPPPTPVSTAGTGKPATSPSTPQGSSKDDDEDEETPAQRVRRRFFVFHASGQKWDFKNKAEMSKFFNAENASPPPPKPEDVTIVQGHLVETKRKVAF